MKNCKKVLSVVLAVFMLAALMTGCGGNAQGSSSGDSVQTSGQDTITVTDYTGNAVEIPANAQHMGAIYGGSPSYVQFFDVADRVACSMDTTPNSWLDEIYPKWNNSGIVGIENPRDPNVEELANLGVDLVFYWSDREEQVKKMNEAGIPVIVATPVLTELPSTFEELRDQVSFELMLYAESFGGGKYVDKANEWLKYYDEKIKYLQDRTASLSDEEKPTVYSMRNEEDGLQCWGKGYINSFMIEAAGGRSVTADLDIPGGQFTTVTMEEIAKWNPDYVFTGWLSNTECITENPQWQSINAVKNDHVILCPASTSTMSWEGGLTAPLWAMFVAKNIHPDLFEDLDLVKEIQYYYKTFYNYDLSAQGAEWMLERCDAQGNPAEANNH